MRTLSHLKGIQAFEAAARHLSFAEAARELNVTPAAIAQLVRSLESWLGTPLFHRSRSGVSRLQLTQAAQDALSSLTRGLDEIDEAIRRVKAMAQRRGITVTASLALATRWLIPHLDRFSAIYPEIEIRLNVTDRLTDFERQEADIGIRCGLGPWPGADSFKLMDEEIVAVCSPALLVADPAEQPITPRWNNLDWIARQIPIHDTSPAQSGVFPDWSTWLAAAGLKPSFASPGLRINSTATVIQSVLNGQGIALARLALVAHDLENGRLRRCLDWHTMPFAWSYYGLVAKSARDMPDVKRFAAWLKDLWQSEYASRLNALRTDTLAVAPKP